MFWWSKKEPTKEIKPSYLKISTEGENYKVEVSIEPESKDAMVLILVALLSDSMDDVVLQSIPDAFREYVQTCVDGVKKSQNGEPAVSPLEVFAKVDESL